MSVGRIGEIVAQPGKEKALQTFIQTVIVPAIEASEGGQSCQVYQNQSDPARFMIVEVWDSIEAHQASVKNITPEEIAEIKTLLADMPPGAYYTVIE
jgi:quinol monooxygenase YgiN